VTSISQLRDKKNTCIARKKRKNSCAWCQL